jgi:hypothetical protein
MYSENKGISREKQIKVAKNGLKSKINFQMEIVKGLGFSLGVKIFRGC